MQKNKETELLRELMKILSKVLKKNTIQELNRKLDIDLKTEKTLNSKHLDFVVARVSGEYNLTSKTILTSKRRGVVTEARKMCFCLLHNELGFTQTLVGRLFDRKKMIVNLAIKDFKTMTPEKNIQHRAFIDVYNKIKIELSEKINHKNN